MPEYADKPAFFHAVKTGGYFVATALRVEIFSYLSCLYQKK